MAELVVPKSIPMIFDMMKISFASCSTTAARFTFCEQPQSIVFLSKSNMPRLRFSYTDKLIFFLFFLGMLIFWLEIIDSNLITCCFIKNIYKIQPLI